MPKYAFAVIFLLFLIVHLWGDASFGYSVPTQNDTVNPTVSLLTPLPGEIWYVGQHKSINWLATDTNLSENGIFIYYSLDSGATFIPLSEAIANTGTYPFLIPEAESDNARVKVMAIDSFGNTSLAINPLSFSYAAPLQVQNVEVSVLGNNIVINWQAVTQNLFLDNVTPDGYLLFESDLPSQSPEDYLLLANTVNTSYTFQQNPLVSRKFYYVVAYKGSLNRLLPLSANPDKPVPILQEIMQLIREKSLGGGK